MRYETNLTRNTMSMYMLNIQKMHQQIVIWIIKYLKNIQNFDFLFDGLLDNFNSFLDYFDIDCVQKLDKSKF